MPLSTHLPPAHYSPTATTTTLCDTLLCQPNALLQVKPGCILRRSNFNVLEREQLVTGKQVDQCKKRMNTFGFVGDLSKDPEVSCVYHSEEAENQ